MTILSTIASDFLNDSKSRNFSKIFLEANLECIDKLFSNVDHTEFQPEICRSIRRHRFLMRKTRFDAISPIRNRVGLHLLERFVGIGRSKCG